MDRLQQREAATGAALALEELAKLSREAELRQQAELLSTAGEAPPTTPAPSGGTARLSHVDRAPGAFRRACRECVRCGERGVAGAAGSCSHARADVKLSAVRSALVVDTIVEVLWAVSPMGERDIWTALITNMLKLVVHIGWLKKTSDGVLVINDEFAQDSWPIKLICDTCADVVEMADALQKAPADVPTGERWWRQPTDAAEASSSTCAASSAAAGAPAPPPGAPRSADAGAGSSTGSKRRPTATRAATGRITFAAACSPTRQTPRG